eukprot:SAG11_NODE_78_length_17939_cov_10.236883_13_plen_54_part_00
MPTGYLIGIGYRGTIYFLMNWILDRILVLELPIRFYGNKVLIKTSLGILHRLS